MDAHLGATDHHRRYRARRVGHAFARALEAATLGGPVAVLPAADDVSARQAGAAVVTVAAAILVGACAFIATLANTTLGTVLMQFGIATFFAYLFFLINALATKGADEPDGSGQFTLGLLLHYFTLVYAGSIICVTYYLYCQNKGTSI